MDDRRLSMSGVRGRAGVGPLLALLAGAASLASCERADPRTEAMVRSRDTFSAVGSGGSAAAPSEVLSKGYQSVLGELSGAGSPDDQAMAALFSAMNAHALSGQGDLAAAKFREADARLMRATNAAAATLKLLVDQRSLARALEGYDPSADIARFQSEAQAKRGELEQVRGRLAEATRRVEAIRAEAAQKLEQSRGMREALAPLQARLTEATSAERGAAAEKLHEERRRADAVAREGELLEARAVREAPAIGELELEVARVERQIEMLEQAAQRARDAATRRAEESRAAAEAARSTEAEARTVVAEVLRVVNEEVTPAFEEARGKMQSAASKLASARGGPAQQVLSSATGAAAQLLGALHREHGEALSRAAQVVESALLDPPIGGAEGVAEAAAGLRSAAEAARAAALEQYEKARGIFESGGSGEAGERLQRLSTRVNEMWVRLGGKAPEAAPESPAEPAAETPAEGSGETPADGPADAPAETSVDDAAGGEQQSTGDGSDAADSSDATDAPAEGAGDQAPPQ
ncbi:MAG: hypothetical protein SFZ24_12485 [Planctomycetota bacterium]|nr:hypothetical protein [Planctomycetota bacterium]